MRFWVRELAGWGLVLLGVGCFGLSLWLLIVPVPPLYFEAGGPSLIGFFLFRGGIHLLKVAVAARICLQAQDKLRPERAAPKAAPRPARPALPGRRFPS
jgi:hypothetical protein